MSDRPQFVFITCQVGAEPAVKDEVSRLWPSFRLAFSRPGFLTFKLPREHFIPDDFDLHSAFARSYGFSLGKVASEDPEAMAGDVWRVWGDRPVDRIHVWQRDAAPPGDHDFEPSITGEDEEVARRLHAACPRLQPLAEGRDALHQAAKMGEYVLDCVRVEPSEWWVGYHRVHSFGSQWPGGLLSLELPADAVSRAWLKMEESLRWSQLPLRPGDRCAEIGSAPGGASQALLSRGLLVVGIDPAEMHATVLAHPNFTHIRRRANQVRRRDLHKIRWLTADMNVAPKYTLDVVEDLATDPAIKLRGLLLTLKLFEWKTAGDLPEYLRRVSSWGFSEVLARQLQTNRQEVAVAAIRTRA